MFLIKLPNNKYVNLSSAATFELKEEKDSFCNMVPVKKSFLGVEYEDTKIIVESNPIVVFKVNGIKVFVAEKSNPKDMEVIKDIKIKIDEFIKENI